MADDKKRIIELNPTTEVATDDWLVLDSPTEDTRKILASVLKAWVLDGVDLDALEVMIASEFVPLTSYPNGSYVIYEDELYLNATGGIIVHPTFSSTVWTKVTITDVFKKLATNLAPLWDSNGSYAKDDIVIKGNQVYVCTADNATSGSFVVSEWATSDFATLIDTKIASAIDEVSETKADKEGFYEGLFAGNLMADSYTADTAPYLYRQSPSASAVSQSIVGASVAWNQLVKPVSGSAVTVNGVTITPNEDGTVTLNGTSLQSGVLISMPSFNVNSGHKYYMSVFGSVSKNGYTSIGGNVAFDSVVRQADNSETTTISIRSDANVTYSNKNIALICIDLTQLFGSTIADHIYSLEQAQSGSGIAWLKSYGFLTKDYYPYNSGELLSVNVSGRKVYDSNDELIATYPTSAIDLRGLFKLQNGNLVADGDVYESDGTVTRNYELRAYQSGDESLPNAITDGTNTIVKLATPTTESANPYDNPQLVGSTEEWIDTRDVQVPVGGERKYFTDLKAKLEEIINGNSYSTTEQVIGTWIDGKPLYQKTYELSSTINLSTTAYTGFTPDNIQVINMLTDAIGYRLPTSTYGTSVSTVFARKQGSTFYLYCPMDFREVKYITLRYTKTTD